MAKRKAPGTRRSILTGWLNRWTQDAVIPGGPALMEELESRTLLSAVHVAKPDFIVYHPVGSVRPAAVNSPTGLTPAQIQQAYGINKAVFGSIIGDGAGQTIAIVDAYNAPTIVSDLHAFDVQFGLSDPPSFLRLSQTGTTTLPGTDPYGPGNSWALEISLDVEWAHAVAPEANILLVEANSASNSDLFRAVDTARKYPGVSVVSMSWGGGEFSSQSTYNSYFTTPAGHTGVTFVASSGDSGAYATSNSTKSVEYPASSPNVVAVGGTYLNVDSLGNYIFESGWGNGTRSGSYGGSGGGISRYTRQPAYQKGVVTQSTTYRAVPDVAFVADPNSGVSVYDSWDMGSAAWVTLGGTSAGAPMWAAVIAIADQGRALAGLSTLDGPTQTLPKLYALPATDFHDITTGNNGYAAGPGYDLVTGRGTPIVNLLVNDLVGATVPTGPMPTIGSLAVSPNSVTAGTAITLTAGNVTDTSSTISSVAFYRESNSTAGLQIGGDTLVGSGLQSGATWTLAASTAGLTPGAYIYYAVATDAASVSSAVASTVLTVIAPSIVANDNFASATLLAGTVVTVTDSNVGATKEPGEPNHAGNVGGKSVWYTWTAPANGVVSLNTIGSNFDTTLAVYTGSDVSALTTVASNDDQVYGVVLTSSLSFKAVSGVTYHIAVDGYNGASGNITLNLTEAFAPANDNFANAAIVTGSTLSWTGSNVLATKEAGEPAHAGNAGGASVWLAWTAPTTRTVTLNTHGSNFDTMLAVYTGGSVSTLTRVASNDDDPAGGTLTSALTFNAIAGQTYFIAIDGYNAGYGAATGNIILNLL